MIKSYEDRIKDMKDEIKKHVAKKEDLKGLLKKKE